MPVTATIVSGKGREEFGGEPGEGAARLVGGDVDRALDLRLGPRHHRDRARGDRVGNEILAVEARAAEGAEHGAGRDLAMVDREAGDGRRLAAAGQRAQVHQCPAAAAAGGISSDVSMSRLSLGNDAEQRAGARDHARRRSAPPSRRRW